MSELVSPKQVAHAIGVSESSLKRWCDQGLIETVRTAGGHRRLPVSAVLEYLQRTGQPLVSPESLGLPPLTPGAGHRSLDKARTSLLEALVCGRDEAARQIVIEAFIARHPIHAIADELIAPTFHEIGRQWGCGEIAVYQERQACDTITRILNDLRKLIPAPGPLAPHAIGGTLESDHYSLPNTLAELVLRDAGWNAVSLGTHLPAESIVAAIEQHHPQLVWLSVSHYRCEEQFVRDVEQLRVAALAVHASFVIGGRMLCEPVRQQMHDLACCDSMHQLDALARALIQSRRNKS